MLHCIPSVESGDQPLMHRRVPVAGETNVADLTVFLGFHERFERAIRLPGSVDASKVKAKGKNGVLAITLPKAQESIGRRIAIEEHRRAPLATQAMRYP